MPRIRNGLSRASPAAELIIPMPVAEDSKLRVCLSLTAAISRSRTVEEIYGAALDALAAGLGVSRSSILLFDRDEVNRRPALLGSADRVSSWLEPAPFSA